MSTTTRSAGGFFNLVRDYCEDCDWQSMPYDPILHRHVHTAAIEHERTCEYGQER